MPFPCEGRCFVGEGTENVVMKIRTFNRAVKVYDANPSRKSGRRKLFPMDRCSETCTADLGMSIERIEDPSTNQNDYQNKISNVEVEN